MITTEAGLQLALEQLVRVYHALAALNAESPRVSESWRAVRLKIGKIGVASFFPLSVGKK